MFDTGTFYDVEIKSGALGTKGGPTTDINGNVLSGEGEPIIGSHAAGNAMASPLAITCQVVGLSQCAGNNGSRFRSSGHVVSFRAARKR